MTKKLEKKSGLDNRDMDNTKKDPGTSLQPVPISCFKTPFSNKRNQSTLEKWLITDLE